MRTIAIVGNGSFDSSQASLIDNADVVVRFNDCRSYGVGGTRTDIVAVCNTGRPGLRMITGDIWTSSPAVKNASAIWCVRDIEKFRELQTVLDHEHPDLSDFSDDYTPGFEDFARQAGKDFAVLPRRVHDWLDNELSGLGSEHYVVPSTGLMTITYVLGQLRSEDDVILLAGFDHTGWSGHPFSAEKVLVERFVATRKLSRI